MRLRSFLQGSLRLHTGPLTQYYHRRHRVWSVAATHQLIVKYDYPPHISLGAGKRGKEPLCPPTGMTSFCSSIRPSLAQT